MIPITKLSLPPYSELEASIKEILESGRLTMGLYLQELEERFAQMVDAKFAIGVNSCTDGLTIALKACATHKGYVITTPFTYIATTHAIIHAGCTPIFADIDPESLNLDPEAVESIIEQEEDCDSCDIAAILPVHVFGNPCNIKELWRVAHKHETRIIWDSAHCSGYSRYHLRQIGGFETAEVFSLAPTKLMTAGEGGIITLNDEGMAEYCRALSRLGLPQNIDFQSDDRIFEHLGYNARLPEISCALALACLDHLDEWGDTRTIMTNLYRNELMDTGLGFQKPEPRSSSANFAFPILVDEKNVWITRDELQKRLRAEGIETRKIWFSPPIHKMPCYSQYSDRLLPNAEKASATILCLPLWSHMQEETVLEVCGKIKKILKEVEKS